MQSGATDIVVAFDTHQGRCQFFMASSLLRKLIMVQLDVDTIAAPRIFMAGDFAPRHEADLIGFYAAESHFVIPTGTDTCGTGNL